MGDWRPPKRNHSGMPPPSPHGGRHSMIGTGGQASWTAGTQPPLTVTGVAPCANKASQPPLTAAGIAPCAVQQQSVVHVSKTDTTLSTLEESAKPNRASVSITAAFETVLKFMDDIKPAAEDEGATPWSKALMEESPTLFPSLKFHDLVFGHELGSGAFGVVKYARLIDKSKTRSHWAEYAVKVISTQKIVEMGYEASVRREIAILRSIVRSPLLEYNLLFLLLLPLFYLSRKLRCLILLFTSAAYWKFAGAAYFTKYH